MNERKVSLCHMNRDTQANEKRFQRNFPSTWLKPNFDLYPIPTKYTTMHVLDQRPEPKVEVMQTQPYNPHLVFNPGNRKAPWEYFAENIDMESNLRNQFFALQKDDRRYYFPETNSDLYVNEVSPGAPIPQKFPLLQKKEIFLDNNPNTCNLAPNMFHNHTRTNFKK